MDLHGVDGPLLQRLNELGEAAPPEVCMSCLNDLRKVASKGAGGVLMAQEKAREQHRLQLWKSRVHLVKSGRQFMAQKMYSEAAVSYEKYLKILEIVFNVEKGLRLTPDHFKESARTEELTVVTSVYWDLLRIYDTSEKYGERQALAGKQLSLFVRFTPIFPDIMSKAEAHLRQAKNPSAFKTFIKSATTERPRCFIATSAFESPLSIEVQTLRHFRDAKLKQTSFGRFLIYKYYKISPRIAAFLDSNPRLKPAVRAFLKLLIKCVS
jgi:hypothetical protein